ncbi:hypothetical protein NCER_100313 [Vairimorpha ceranae BRL01]|uniref:UBC core domain-containing protein n=2 Tax=Vairimorpha ceranae TaxID=40302 RepID=C4V793_VAIC1|nr:ubiquitin conjugating enzyme e2 [Vairimorpha ceranae]EEQ82898.1 hypothetical protein NCER_100313 [Vairimorpha ceranae BRL01]KAF5139922.1 hypothetical protein G9O61_00g019410 [Vairimorpha ceranae]KKO75270.1 ubiquitin conjugating enzyme e2 [Vairimorpha ceranae]
MVLSFCEFRIKNELTSLVLLENTSYTISYSPPIINYVMYIKSGLYKNRSLSFTISFPQEYPFASPKIKCNTKIFHPSIDEEGNTCLEILRLNWKCTYGIQNIFINLYTIFINLDCDTPLNTEAGDLMIRNWDEFVSKVNTYK